MIKKLSLTNFRGHTRILEFGPGLNLIKGKNEAGKSTIKEAFAFVMQGTDSAGTKNPDHLITVGEDVATVSLQTGKATITRRKKRAATSTTKLERDGIPAVSMSQTDMQNQIKLSHEVFMSCWNVGYFMDLTQAQKMKVLGEIASVDRKSLLAGILPPDYLVPSWVTLLNPKIDANKATDLRRQSQNKKVADDATLAQVHAQLETYSGSGLVDVVSSQQQINELEARLQSFRDYERAASFYANTIAANEAKRERYKSASVALETSKSKRSELEAEISDLSRKIGLHTEAIKEGTEVLSGLKGSLKEVTLQPPTKPRVVSGSVCPTCGHAADPSIAQKAMGQYEAELQAYNAHERSVEDFNKPLRERMQDADRKIDENNSRKNILQGIMHEKQRQLSALSSTIESDAAFLKEFKTPADPSAPQRPEGDEQDMSKTLIHIKSAVHSARMHSEQCEKLVAQKNNLLQSISRHTSDIEALAILERALLALPELETAKTLEVITVNGVKLALTDGELVVTDEKGVDYRSLSDGRRMKIDLAFCGAIRRQAGPYAPGMIFLDNADLIDKLELPQNIQILVAKVDPNADEVVVIPQ